MDNPLDKETVRKIRKSIEGTLSEELAQYGLSIRVGNIRFTPSSLRCKLEASLPSHKEIRDSQLTTILKSYGLSKKASNGDIIVGLNGKSKKYPFLVCSADGKTYKYSLLLAIKNFKGSVTTSPIQPPKGGGN